MWYTHCSILNYIYKRNSVQLLSVSAHAMPYTFTMTINLPVTKIDHSFEMLGLPYLIIQKFEWQAYYHNIMPRKDPHYIKI